tara:strand:- start:10099 stop:10950 length:852 start_codon:yes stop_codon:yes gene_type:complete
MKNYLKEKVTQLAKPSFRNADGNSWNSAVVLMETLIKETGKSPQITEWGESNRYKNFTIRFPGEISKTVILGAHYDTYAHTPGADDNASSVAVLLCILKQLPINFKRYFSFEIIFYACEEPPFFDTDEMGSYIDASKRKSDEIEMMICLEMVGYFSNKKNSQNYPFGILKYIYGNRGNFIIGVSNRASRKKGQKYMNLLKAQRKDFYKSLLLPISFSGLGLDWSDHRSYWNIKAPAIMLTDTAMFRNPNYHEDSDTPETLDYEKMQFLTQDLLNIITQQLGNK